MRKNISNSMARAAAVIISLSLLTACSSKESSNNNTTTSPTAAVTETENGQKTTGTEEATPAPTSDAGTVTSEPEVTTPAEDPAVTDSPESPILSKSDYTMINVEYKTKDLESTFDMSDITKIFFSDDNVTVSGKKEVRVTDIEGRQTVTITQKGKYLISGTCSNGQIIVNADKDKDVRLILNGLDLTCPDSAAIYERQCDKLLVTTVGGTENTLRGTKDFVYEDVEKKNPDACIFAKDDLVINGNGVLNIKTESAEGIHSTDSVKLISGTINIDSGDRAIRGKEFVIIKAADININSAADAIRTTIDDEDVLGYIVIQGGNIKIETESEGIQATGNVQITGGNIDINADGKKANAIKSDKIVYIENATVIVNSEKDIKAVSGLIIDEGTVKVRGK